MCVCVGGDGSRIVARYYCVKLHVVARITINIIDATIIDVKIVTFKKCCPFRRRVGYELRDVTYGGSCFFCFVTLGVGGGVI